MRSNLAFISTRIGVNLAESGTNVLISWRAWPSNSTLDPVTQSRTGTPTTQTMRAQAFLHFPEIKANSVVRQFNEIEAGDCIADFSADVALDGLDSLTFTFLNPDGTPIDGSVWVTKPISERLARSWGAIIQGARLFRTVLLRRQT